MNEQMNKELFLEIMAEVQKVYDYHENFNSFLHQNGVEGYIFQPDCISSVLKLLHMMFETTDSEEWISYFCFELDFGRKWKDGMIHKLSKTEIRLRNSEDLYGLLVPDCKVNENE